MTADPVQNMDDVVENIPSSPAKFSKRPRNKPQKPNSDLGSSIKRLVRKRKTEKKEEKVDLTEEEFGKKENQEKAFSDFSSVLKSVQDTLQGIMDIKQKQKAKKKEQEAQKTPEKRSKKTLPKTPEMLRTSSDLDRSAIASPKPKRSKISGGKREEKEKSKKKTSVES